MTSTEAKPNSPKPKYDHLGFMLYQINVKLILDYLDFCSLSLLLDH